MPIFYTSSKYISGKQEDVTINNVPSLSKVEMNLCRGKYVNHLWKFIQDVNEAFDFIRSRYTKKTKVFGVVNEYQQIFSNQMDILMQELGYCCGQWYILEPRAIGCNGNGVKGCVIPQDSLYYRYHEWTFCSSCFQAFTDDPIKLDDEDTVSKDQFMEYFFSRPRAEEFVRCGICKKKSHVICVLYYHVAGQSYYCQQCCETNGFEKHQVRASKLPQSECDIFVDNFLKSHGINNNNVLTIRLLSDIKKQLKVKKVIQDFRCGPKTFQYRNCTLFTFFDTGLGTDICFFSVYFQLYASDCAGSNRNIAYISYIDSVNLFPSTNRTIIYRMILLALFEFLKTQGFLKIYLWSCPPRQNQDYIFYMKPPKMKMPTKERLSNWYVDLFKLGKDLEVIDSYEGIHEHAKAENWKNVSDIPYMDCDLWTIRLEEAVKTVLRDTKKLNNDVAKLQKQIEIMQKASNFETKKLKNAQKLLSKKLEEIELTKDQHAILWKLINVQIRGFNSEYFAIRLTTPTVVVKEDEEHDKIERVWLNDRSSFVDFLWEYTLEFSTERRAQFSTSLMLYRIFAESNVCVKCSEVSTNGLNNELFCEDCHKKDFPQVLRIPKDFLCFNLTPQVRVKRCQLSSSLQSEELEVQQSEVEPALEVKTSLSRESSVTTDSGLGETSPRDDIEISHENISMIENSDIEDQLCAFQWDLANRNHRRAARNHYTRSKCPTKMFEKPRIVARVSISDGE